MHITQVKRELDKRGISFTELGISTGSLLLIKTAEGLEVARFGLDGVEVQTLPKSPRRNHVVPNGREHPGTGQVTYPRSE